MAKYDLIVVGGGPAGLMAAKQAAEDGMKVVLVERKKDITRIDRACVSIFYTRKLSPSSKTDKGAPHNDGYVENVAVECGHDYIKLHFPDAGFSLDYDGDLRPYLSWVQVSPSLNQIYIYKVNGRPWAFHFDKEALVSGLLARAQRAGAEIRTETTGLAAENVEGGVRVRVRDASGERVLDGRAAIAADGLDSRIIDSLSVKEKRETRSLGGASYAHHLVEGLEAPLPPNSWWSFSIPSVNPYGTIMIGQWKDNMNTVGAMCAPGISPVSILQKLMADPRYAPWFRNARVTGTQAVAFTGGVRTPLIQAVEGNVVFAGDAGLGESWVQGAVAQAFRAVKAIQKELGGEPGYQEYVKWRQNAFAIFRPDYWNVWGSTAYSLMKLCTDEEVDFLFKLFQGRLGILPFIVANNLDAVKRERPQLHEKLVSSAAYKK